MRVSKHLAISTIGTLFALGFAHGALADGPGPTVTVEDMFAFPNGPAVIGVATLTREKSEGRAEKAVRMDVSASELLPDGAYSFWWVVFNHPEKCFAGTIGRCGAGDLPMFGGDPAVEASLLWGAGFVADGTGSANISASLQSSNPPGEVVFGPGLTEVAGADIHGVLRFHGPAVAGMTAEVVSNFNGGCPGGEGCSNVQFSPHEGIDNDDDDDE